MSRVRGIPLITILCVSSALSCAAGLACAAPAAERAVQAQNTDAAAAAGINPEHFESTSDWPSRLVPVPLTSPYHDARLRKEALRRFASAPASVSTAAWLLRAKLPAEALKVLGRIVNERPDQMADAFEPFQYDFEFRRTLGQRQRESSRQLRVQLEEVLKVARARLPGLSREQQAALVWVMFPLELLIAPAPADMRSQPAREQEFMRRFVVDYAGTRAAGLIEVQLIATAPPRMGTREAGSSREDSRLASLARYAAEHPGTDAAAMALHTRAIRVANDGLHDNEDDDRSDRLERLVEVLRIVEELERGKYPRSRWTDGASSLVFEVSFYRAKLSVADADRALDMLLAFLRARPGLMTDPVSSERAFSLFLHTLPQIAAQSSGGAQTTARVLDELWRSLPDPAIGRMMKVRLLQIRRDDAGFDDAAVVRELEAIAASEAGGGLWSRRAWIMLAEHDIIAGRLVEARARYDAFARRFPASDYAWMAAIRIGQIDHARGQHEAAATIWLDMARRYGGGVLLARVIGPLYAAHAFEAAGAFDRARDAYREAAAAWTDDLGDSFGDYGPSPLNPRELRARPDRPPVLSSRTSVARRAAQLTASLSSPGGRDLERGRWLFAQGRVSDAIATLAAVVKSHAGTSAATEARVIWHRARLEAALDQAASTSTPTNDPNGLNGPNGASGGNGAHAANPANVSLDVFDALSGETFDTPVGIAGIAGATLRHLHGRQADADARMRSVLQRWVAEGSNAGQAPAQGTLEADVLAVRDALFQPLGGGTFKDDVWNAFKFPAQLPAFVAAPSALMVKSAGGEAVLVDVSRQPRGLSNVIFLASEDVAFLSRLVTGLGGAARRAPRAVMETPHQPIGDASSIVTWWNTFFPARPGHWNGFEVLTYPAFSNVEFLDAARTRALVPMTIGYSGATAVLEKIDGIWKVTGLVDQWIT